MFINMGTFHNLTLEATLTVVVKYCCELWMFLIFINEELLLAVFSTILVVF